MGASCTVLAGTPAPAQTLHGTIGFEAGQGADASLSDTSYGTTTVTGADATDVPQLLRDVTAIV